MNRFWKWMSEPVSDLWRAPAERDVWKERCLRAEQAKTFAETDLARLLARPDWQVQYVRELGRGDELRAELRDAHMECLATEARCDALESGKTASGLSPAQVERLALLAMAAGKLAAEVGKVILYGWASRAPGSKRPAYADVERGMGRVQAMTELMAEAGDVRGGDVRAHAARTKERIDV